MNTQIKEQTENSLRKAFVQDKVSLQRLETLFLDIHSRYGITSKEILSLIQSRVSYYSIPSTLFHNTLSPLENVVYYLHAKYHMTQTEIAHLLNRDHTTIWTTLENSMQKMKEKEFISFIESLSSEQFLIPLSIFSQRSLSILESVGIYLKENFHLTYHTIASMLGKDDRTIWTVISRAQKKINA